MFLSPGETGVHPVTNVRIETAALGGSALSRLAQAGSAPTDWYTARPRAPDEWRAHVDRVRAAADPRWYDALAAAFGGSSGGVPERLQRVLDGRGVVVTTGQQPGLFGGPIYTWSKALSALALA